MMKQYLFFALFILGAFTACKKSGGSADDSGFDGQVNIKMSETVDSTKRTLMLNCFTAKIYPCANYSIQSAYTITNDKITVDFIKIINPGICLTAIGPASATIKLEALANKNYVLEINIGTAKITGHLDVSVTNFKVSLPTQTKIQFVNTDLARIPGNTIYGKVHYHKTSTAPLVQKFIDSLQLLGAIPALYPQGDYGQFTIEANGQIEQKQDPGYYFTRYYILNYTNTSAQLKTLVRRFGVNYPDSLLITLKTTRGETFYSWVP